MRRLLTLLVFGTFLTGCASALPFHSYYDEDQSGRFYKTEDGTILKVEPSGTVRMVVEDQYYLRPQRIVGQTRKVGEGELWDWDMSQYQVVEPTGSCKSLYTREPAVSCWNRVWEIFAAPWYILGTAVELAGDEKLGLRYAKWMQIESDKIVFDVHTCRKQPCSEQEITIIQERIAYLRNSQMQQYAIMGYRQQQPPLGFQQPEQPGMIPTPDGRALFGPITPNVYGPGIHSDGTGRPFEWKPDFGGPALGPISPNAYGPGIGMDGTGRPVRPSCPPGMMC